MASLRTLEVELQAVTPLWTGGASRQTEVRPPSVRGALRFWFRALAGGLLGEELASVSRAESAVFGGINRASPVVVRLFGSPRIRAMVIDGAQELPGMAYMFWSVFQQKRDPILPGERFRLRLNSRPFPFAPVEVEGRTLGMTESFELAAASLWLMVRLGGVGARSRRGGGGTMAVANPADWPEQLPPLLSTARAPAELAEELSRGLQQVRQVFGWPARPPADPSSYDVLHERVCQLYLTDLTFPSWWEALNWAGEQFHMFRVEHKLDATGVAALLLQGRMAANTIKRAVFGLPINFFFKSIFAELTSRGIDSREARRKASASVSPSRGMGRASPLFFRILPLATNPTTYTVLMGVFRSRLLPDHEMVVKPSDYSLRPARIDVPTDFSPIDQWFDHVKRLQVGLVTVPLG
ncbi:MAG: type III-B CRISPR module RAMP protein Cmr1 [Isosphaeraceae bacterium]